MPSEMTDFKQTVKDIQCPAGHYPLLVAMLVSMMLVILPACHPKTGAIMEFALQCPANTSVEIKWGGSEWYIPPRGFEACQNGQVIWSLDPAGLANGQGYAWIHVDKDRFTSQAQNYNEETGFGVVSPKNS